MSDLYHISIPKVISAIILIWSVIYAVVGMIDCFKKHRYIQKRNKHLLEKNS